MPTFLLLGAVSSWAIFSLAVRGYLPAGFYTSPYYIARFDDDPFGGRGRDLNIRLSRIAPIYSLQRPAMIQRGFSSSVDVSSWLHDHPKVGAIITGRSNWLTVYLGSRVARALVLPGEENLRKIAAQFGLTETDAFALRRNRKRDRFLAIGVLPSQFSVPGEPQLLVDHFLTWFLSAVAAPPLGNSGGPSAESFLPPATSLRGKWISSTPPGVASLYLGSLSLIDGVESGGLPLSCATRMFKKAQSYVIRKNDAELSDLLVHNSLILNLMKTRSKVVKRRILRKLSALAVNGHGKSRQTLGSRLAAFNLYLLRE